MLRNTLKSWFKANRRDFPWRRTQDPYRVLVAEVLLQQTLAPKVVSAYEEIVERYGSPTELARAPVRELRRSIRPLGLLKRAEVLKRLSATLVVEHMGAVPNSKDALKCLPGVGEYTASAVRCFAFGEREAVVDTNVERVLGRFFGIVGQPNQARFDRELRAIAEECLPRKDVAFYNWALLDLGFRYCKRHLPRCSECPLRRRCACCNGQTD